MKLYQNILFAAKAVIYFTLLCSILALLNIQSGWIIFISLYIIPVVLALPYNIKHIQDDNDN